MSELEPVDYDVWLKTDRRRAVKVTATTWNEAKRLGAAQLRTNVQNVDAQVVTESGAA
jgi:hypothetical protein